MVSFFMVESGFDFTFRDSVIACIPAWIYGLIYLWQVALIGEANGGWEDLYHVLEYLPFPVALAVPAYALIVLGLALLIQWLYNRLTRRRLERMNSRLWPEDVDPAEYSDGFQVTLQLPEVLTGRDFRLYHLHDGIVEELKLNTVSETLEDGSEQVTSVSFVTPSFSEFVLSYRQLTTTVISANGQTWEITVTYDESAGIPDNATLQVREILPEDEAYVEYYTRSMERIRLVAASPDEAAADNNSETETDAEIADAEPAETDEAEDTDANPSGIEDTQAAFAN